MTSVLISLVATLRGIVRSRAALHVEILALRHQLRVLQRSQPRRLRLGHADRWLWTWMSQRWRGWRTALVIVKPETVVAWHRQGFRLFWTWKSHRPSGRPPVCSEARALIRKRAHENPLWGAPRIHGDLLKLGVQVSQATVAKAVLRTILKSYLTYYTNSRTHLSLDKDSPHPRSVCPRGDGCITAISQVGGLHHRYERRAA